MESSFVGRPFHFGPAKQPAHRPIRVSNDEHRSAVAVGTGGAEAALVGRLVDERPLRLRVALLRGRVRPGLRRARWLGGRRVVYFVGSIFFTSAATIQWFQSGGLAFPLRRLGWWSAIVQLVGTLYFNATTFRALQTGLDANEYDRLVWTPDALGSVCFLVASYLACVEISGLSARPLRTRDSVIATANLVGSVAFGIAAVASFVVPSNGSALDLAAANLFTALGGVCFFVGAVLLGPASPHQGDAVGSTDP
jgi:YrhK-like protein